MIRDGVNVAAHCAQVNASAAERNGKQEIKSQRISTVMRNRAASLNMLLLGIGRIFHWLKEDDDWLLEELLHGAPRSFGAPWSVLRSKIRVCGAELSSGCRIGEGTSFRIDMLG